MINSQWIKPGYLKMYDYVVMLIRKGGKINENN